MFEHITYEKILQKILEKVPNTVDKREGSIIYDAIAPAAIELQNLYISLDNVLNESFADTASLPYLMRRAAERGLTRYPATNAILKAVSVPQDINIPIGSRFSLNELNYVVTEKVADGEYNVQCETLGDVGNSYLGNTVPIDYIEGLQTFEITEILIPGEDAEDVEELRKRYFDSISAQAFGGNIADYINKAFSIEGVGGVKVTPIWNGGGTVKLTIMDSAFNVPSEELVNKVQEAIDPTQNQGQGKGLAPIGHVVTVEPAEAVPIKVRANLYFKEGWAWEDVKTNVEKAVDNYFLELSKGWDETNDSTLTARASFIEAAILQCEGVEDITDTHLENTLTKLEGSKLSLTKYQLPVRSGDVIYNYATLD